MERETMSSLLLLTILDGSGVYGHILHYSLMFAMIGSAVLVFIYLWRKGRLDMDEDPKRQMMNQEEEGGQHGT
jgi:hypothetical protein